MTDLPARDRFLSPVSFRDGDPLFQFWNSYGIVHGDFLRFTVPGHSMLHSMQQTAQAPSTPSTPSFAGLLAALTAPAPKTAWNNDDLADDVATLSYEHALRAHARYKPSDPFAPPELSGAEESSGVPEESSSTAQTASLWAAPGWSEDAKAGSTHEISTLLDRNKKCASITIRLSKSECDQLRQRAAQAGLTVSAYLRSCTFEAEALRAQVKEVLAELRTAAAPGKQGAQAVARQQVVRRSWVRRSWLVRLRSLWPRWYPGQRAAQA